MRLLTLGAMALALASAFSLYAVNYDTRRLAAHVKGQERAITQAHSDIAVLKAERAHLGRPERIEPLARALGLRPVVKRQLVAAPQEAVTRALSSKGAALEGE